MFIFADDMELFLIIDNPSDCHLLQEDYNRLVKWINSPGLPLNPYNCSIMFFYHRSSPIVFSYIINNLPLNHIVDLIRVIGFIFTSNFYSNKHIESISCKSLKNPAFISRVTHDFLLSSFF